MRFVMLYGSAKVTARPTYRTNGVNLDTVGWILMAVGAAGVLLSLIFWSSWAGPGYWSGRRRATYVDDAPPY